MLSKEEIEVLKQLCKEVIQAKEKTDIRLKINKEVARYLLNCIELESREQKLIERLKEESKQFNEETREIAIKLNEARDFIITDKYEEAENEEYILDLEEKYKNANRKRIRTNEILEILKGKNDE